jgi:hypothetical protein
MGAQTTQANFAAITQALSQMQDTLGQILAKLTVPGAGAPAAGAQSATGERRQSGG